MYTTAAFFIINQSFEHVILHEKPDLKYRYKYRCIQNASTKMMHLFCIEYLPQNFTSADLTENYDLIDSVEKRLQQLRKTSAQLTSLFAGTQLKVKQKVE